MTDTPIIRAARALALKESGTDCYDDLDERKQHTLQESVRVALGAVREPSEAMVLANSDAGGPDDEQTIADWQAMIDAALSE